MERHQLNLVRNMLIDHAEDFAGFMIAYIESNPYRLGFHFLGIHNRHSVEIHADARGLVEQFAVTVRFVSNKKYPEKVDPFLIRFLAHAAKSVGVSSAQRLTEQLLAVTNLWRFAGFVDGQVCTTSDHVPMWQVLWGRIAELTRSRIACGRVPRYVMIGVMEKLHACSVEGQIVLDK